MSYRTILLAVRSDGAAGSQMRAAAALAKRLGARLRAVHASAPAVMTVGYGEAPFADAAFYEAQRTAAAENAERVEAAWREACGPDAAADLVTVEGEPAGVLAAAARTADLTLAAQEANDGSEIIGPAVIDDLIVAAAGPVLMLPRAAPSPEGFRRVVVGWDGGRAASRALKDALPFLHGAEQVTLVTFGEAEDAGLEDAVRLLAAHGIKAEALAVADGEGTSGERLLAIAADRHADLLVMGGYGHSRLRELVLGGTTRHVLRHAALPVLFSA
ncbi:MAG: universal stress protein [Geminicoccaceae bacterium]|nr:universal stress protein [Geminicoccaceae bacterium]